MKWKMILCVSVLILRLRITSGQISEDEFHSKKTVCCQQKETSPEMRCRNSKPPNASWELVNTTNGRYHIKFPVLDGCYYKSYVATLSLNESVTTEEQCRNTIVDHTPWPTHTKKELKVKNDSCNKICDKGGELYFQFIFDGCYKLEIRPDNRQVIRFPPKFLHSTYQKQSLVGTTRELSAAKPKSGRQFPAILQINMDEYPWKEMWLTVSMLTFTFKNNTWQLWLLPDKRVSCNETADTTQLPECDINSDDILEVRLPGVEPGDYQYKVQLSGNTDNRCKLSTLWTEADLPCMWTINHTVKWEQPKNKTDYGNQTTPLYLEIYGPITFGVCVVLIFTFLVIKYTMNRKPPKEKGDPEKGLKPEPVVEQRPAILLLYSRDCTAFMKLMESFRQLLEKVTEFEIYDCYDRERWSEVSLNPSEWMQRLATSREVRVIAVASQCASLRQRAHLDGCAVHFAEPLNVDQMFAYGLQMVTDGLARITTYETTFVVRFDGFSDDNYLFQVLNSYTRFVLPLHLGKLLCSLNQSKADEINESWLSLEEGKILCKDLETLVQFKQENPDYLQIMLVVENASNQPGIPSAVTA